MRAAVVVFALLFSGCGAACVQERTTVEGLRQVVAATDNEQASLTLEAAERALSACEEREEGAWFEQLIALFVKAAISAALSQ